jgi:CheY-like chemotaxis protein
MPLGGRLHLITANTRVDPNRALDYGDVSPGLYVALTVSDTGVGMSPEVQAHLFEPFFSTKEIGKGTGLGLSTVYGIIKQSGGHISVYSEPGVGTTFNMYLPQSRSATQPAPIQPAPPEAVVHGDETILLVEDQAPVRKLAARLLERAGYRVLDARDAAEAMEVSRRFDGPIHLMLTDIVMPGMNGHELARELRRERPDTKVVYMSGHPETVALSLSDMQAERAFLRKPFTNATLTQCIREVLEAPA